MRRIKSETGLLHVTTTIHFLYFLSVMMEAMERLNEGIKVGGKLIRDVRFAADQGMVAGTEEGLKIL